MRCCFTDFGITIFPHVQMPANEHLRAGLAVLFRNFRISGRSMSRKSAPPKGAPRLNADAAFLAVRLQLAFLEGRVQLDLVDGRKRQALGLQLLQVTNLEV